MHSKKLQINKSFVLYLKELNKSNSTIAEFSFYRI